MNTSRMNFNELADKLNDMQEYIEGIQGFALVLKENLYNSGGMDEQHARAAAYVAEEIHKNLDSVMEMAVEVEEALVGGGEHDGAV